MTQPKPNQSMRAGISRREMIKLAAFGLALPLVGTACATPVRRRRSLNNTLQIGCIATGRMGRSNMRSALQQGLASDVDARVVAVCDANAERAADAVRMVEEFYAENLPEEPAVKVAVYRDYREMLARRDIDGVLISTPDHAHAFNGIDAANARKDIYIEKPLTYSIEEGKALVRAVRRNRVVLQTGSQQRADARFRQACELVRNGRLGKLRRIHITLPPDSGEGVAEPMPVPPELDYDAWLGPAEWAPYTEDRVHPQSGYSRPGFLQIERYCLGMITGWGTHMFDIAQWANGTDDTGPVEVEATAEFPERGLFNVHTEFESKALYGNGVELTAKTGRPAGVRFEGDDGWLFVRRGALEIHDPALLEEEPGPVRLYQSEHHMRDFLLCMRSRRDPACPVEVGHRSNSICVMTHIAMKLDRKLHWDPATELFIHDRGANRLLSAPYRDGWTL